MSHAHNITRNESIVDTVRTPNILKNIIGTPVLQALLSLTSGNKDPNYYASHSNLVDISHKFTREQFKQHAKKIKDIYGEDGVIGFKKDLRIIEKELNSWEEVKALWKSGFLTDRAIRRLFSLLLSNNKISSDDLSLNDKEMFGYNELQMKTLILSGCAIFSFNPEINQEVIDILENN